MRRAPVACASLQLGTAGRGRRLDSARLRSLGSTAQNAFRRPGMSERNSKDRSNLDGPISVGILRLELLHAADACEAVMRGELGTKEFLEDLQSLARCLTEAR